MRDCGDRLALFENGDTKSPVNESVSNRELTSEERKLARWMLEHAEPDARGYLPQLERARVLPWRCVCGCASINFVIDGLPEPKGPMRVIADFVFGGSANKSGIFVFKMGGVVAGLEVYGLAGDAPKILPSPDALRPFPGN